MGSQQVRAIIGARVSHMQGEEKTSHITQRTKGEAYAEAQGWEVVGAFEDLDVSAIKLSPWQRPDLKRWLDNPHQWDALVFAKTDRVFRSANDCVKLAEWCKEQKKILVLIDDGLKLDYYHPEDAKDAFAGALAKVFLILAAVFAEIEGQRFVQRAQDRVISLRDTDRWGQGIPPFGFRIVDHRDGKGRALDHDDEAQKLLHTIARMFLGGDSLTRIANWLNESGIPSPMDWMRIRQGREAQGKKWTVSKLQSMLSNPTTQGIKSTQGRPRLKPDGTPIMVGPPSFDEETWAQIQAELAERSTGPRNRRHTINPLLGVAKCGFCGKNLRQRSQTTPYGDYRYFVCGNSPKPCPGVSIRADEAETLVLQAFMETHKNRRVTKRMWQEGSDNSHELERTNKTIEALREDRAMGLYTSDEDVEKYRTQMQTLVARRDELAAQPVIKSGWVDVEQDETYGDVWPDATPDEKRRMLIDAEVRLIVRRPDDRDLFTDLDRVLGEGSKGGELMDELYPA
ncbi:recombinase family protein [Nocardia cyriacigeorgica]|uniref:recombinase family protein n=1 Tax=Nocardia cyriacigeorgica TaxID=135487 RepID=UPI002454B5C2|nr:recombinase family protein [Nocardia cyriacigeorgica]